MGSDRFICYCGLRFVITEREVEAVEMNLDERVLAARNVGLHCYLGRLTDGEPHFLLIGIRLGAFGIENDAYRSLDQTTLERTMVQTRAKLARAGLSGEPELHFQLEGQY
jgi:hypothetical protein